MMRFSNMVKAGMLSIVLTMSFGINTPADVHAEQASVQNITEEAVKSLEELNAQPKTAKEVKQVVEATKLYDALSEEFQEEISPSLRAKLAKAQEAAAAVNHTSNGISVSGELPWYVVFRAEKTDSTDAPVSYTVLAPYKMSLWDAMQEKDYDLAGSTVKVTMDKPDQKGYENLAVLHYPENGGIEYLKPEVKDGKLSFETDSFSIFKIAGSNVLVGGSDKIYENTANSQKPVKTDDNNKPAVSTVDKAPSSGTAVGEKPQTSDRSDVIFYVSIGAGAFLLFLCVMVHLDLEKKRKTINNEC